MTCHGDAISHDNYRSIFKLACPWWPSPFAVLSGTWRASALNANGISSWSNSPVYLDRWTLPSFLAYAWVLGFALLRHTVTLARIQGISLFGHGRVAALFLILVPVDAAERRRGPDPSAYARLGFLEAVPAPCVAVCA
ncbi:hypothetical protein GE21DRAFT_1057173 [Neurospora crassa]|nr:hypothetical protein GE21DRAFT_1057173 [Neurospora crassa]